MSRILFDDGKEVELSEETESELRKTLLPKAKIFEKEVIYHLAIMKTPDCQHAWRIFSGTAEAIKDWDGRLGFDNKYGDEYYFAAWDYNRDDMKRIAETILEMIHED